MTLPLVERLKEWSGEEFAVADDEEEGVDGGKVDGEKGANEQSIDSSTTPTNTSVSTVLHASTPPAPTYAPPPPPTQSQTQIQEKPAAIAPPSSSHSHTSSSDAASFSSLSSPAAPPPSSTTTPSIPSTYADDLTPRPNEPRDAWERRIRAHFVGVNAEELRAMERDRPLEWARFREAQIAALVNAGRVRWEDVSGEFGA
ncbi:hypothetical protein HDK64DRAFT_271578 [Phyllosticta capitalensis]